jgi:hypothetical protein
VSWNIMDMQNSQSDYLISPLKSDLLDDTQVHFIEVRPKDKFFQDFDFIVIKNFYSHTVNIVQFANDKWKCVLAEFKLMSDPDCDDEAEKYSLIRSKLMKENGYSSEAEILRFYLTQESELWNSFSLKEIRFVKESEEKEIIKYNQNKSRFEFPSLVILNDREDINQKNIELMKTGMGDSHLSLFK